MSHGSIEAALLRELAAEWHRINRTYFREALRAPLLELGDAAGQLGAWKRQGRVLSLSRALVKEEPWAAVVEVLKHEMAHQYVDEALRATDETAHGPAFQQVCRRLAIDPAASGLPQPEERVMRRLQRLLALAESPELHEAEAAMKAAQRLMLQHNIQDAAGERRYGFRQLGAPAARRPVHEKILSVILTDHFFVAGIWVSVFDAATGKRGRVLEIQGTAENLEIAAWVHGWLLETGERLWRQHRDAGALSGEAERRSFLSGLMLGFQEKLAAQARQHEEVGLVWAGDGALEDYAQRRYPRRQTRRSGALRGGEALDLGQAAGRALVLRKPVTGATQDRGRLLKG